MFIVARTFQSSAKYDDTTKYMTGLMDKTIAKVNQNELD
jgi:hypothetical protein